MKINEKSFGSQVYNSPKIAKPSKKAASRSRMVKALDAAARQIVFERDGLYACDAATKNAPSSGHTFCRGVKVSVSAAGAPEEGCVEQEADGSRDPEQGAGDSGHAKIWPCFQSLGWNDRQPGPFPETNLFSGARHGRVCLCPERRRVCGSGRAKDECGNEFGVFVAAAGSSGWQPYNAAAPAVDPDPVSADDSPAAEAAKAVAVDAGGIKTGDRVTTAGGIRGIILSIKDDSIIIRVAPDNLKLEVAKNAIASVTTQEHGSGS